MANIEAGLLILLVFVIAAGSGQAYVESSFQPENWRESLGFGEEKVSTLHFYYHSSLGGNHNATSIQVAQANSTAMSPTFFGALFIDDNPLTEGPDWSSTEVGRAQGIEGFSGKDEAVALMAISFDFTQGTFNGSSFNVLSRNPISEAVRELAIVGGTGAFRLAKGFTMIKTVEFSSANGVTVEFNVTIIHY